MSRALIFVNGQIADSGAARTLVKSDDIILAADGGARHALALGVIPSAIIGDLDSLTASEVRVFEDMEVLLLRFPTSKNETDLELALLHAIRAGYSPIIIIGAYGGRLDQTIGNLALLASPEAIRANVRLDDGITEAFFTNSKAVIHGKAGDTVSFIPWGNPAEGVSTEGLVYPLNKETLFPDRTRSISNQMLARTAQVRLFKGLLLCVHIRNNSK
jgi:thiamine pyrophosphokinase